MPKGNNPSLPSIGLEEKDATAAPEVALLTDSVYGSSDSVELLGVLDSVAVFIGLCSPDGAVRQGNLKAVEGTGFKPADFLGKRFSEIAGLWPSSQESDQASEMIERAARGETAHGELRVQLADGRIGIFDATFSPMRDHSGQIEQIVLSGVEITERKRAESALVAVNRSLSVLTACNEALIRATSEEELLQRICRLIIDVGGYRFAWIGYPEQGASKRVRPVASAGFEAGYLQKIDVHWDDTQRGDGPTGRAIRERCLQLHRRIEIDAEMASWRTEALKRGYGSSIAVPLLAGSECLGALSIYSDEPNDFNDTEATLLTQLAADLAFGIEALRVRVKHERAQTQIRTFRRLLDRTNDLIYVIDAQTGSIIDANNAVSRLLGYSRQELLKMRVADFSVPVAATPWPERMDSLRRTGSTVVESQHRRKSGELVPVEVSISYVEQDSRRFLINVARDISERKGQEEHIARLGRISKMHSSINAAVLRIRDRDELLQEACRIATQVGGYDRAVVSIVDPDGRSARPSFRAGAGADFPEPALLEIGDSADPDTCLTSRALRTGEVAVCSDINQSEPPVAMRDDLIRLGFKSLVALPLIVDGGKVGALTLASRDGNLVRDAELPLLQDMMASLSFALRSQRHADTARFLETYDSATGLAKRALFCQRVDSLLRERWRPDEQPAVVVFDIHQLSNVNDSFGRHCGDALLQSVAERLKSNAQNDERVGYLGSGTFALLERQSASSEESINSLLDTAVFGEPFLIEGRGLRMSCRSGVARFPVDGGDGSTLLAKAEAALRRAKDTGERYLHYRVEMQSELAQRLALEHKLRDAIDGQQFEIHYQPQVSVESGYIESVEALLRWNDPDHGLTQPAAFLPVLESSGLIVVVGNWVLSRVVKDCERWHALGLRPVRVAVNVSALQFRRRNFVPFVLGLVSNWPLVKAGFGIDLEITETSLLNDLEGTSRKLKELRAAGVRIALDDFGTGYSSLGLLSKLPVDLLKIDRSFVTGLPHDSASVNLTSSIIGLASAFGLITVAEGVENRAQWELLKSWKCSQSQGYFHCSPIPVQEMDLVLARGKLP